MSPLLRTWAWVAIAFALILALRGALAAALAVLLLSPAPLLAWRRADGVLAVRPLAWFAIIAAAFLLLFVVLLGVVATGGLPQVHEWRALLRD